MKLSKIVPERTKTIEFEWLTKNYLVMDQRFRDIRATMKRKFDRCFWCGYVFKDGDMMALACDKSKGKGNVPLCQKCATEAGEDE